MRKGGWWVVAAAMAAGCAGQKQQLKAAPAVAKAEVAQAAVATAVAPGSRRYVDTELGFEISRPDGNWQLDANDQMSSEGLVIPLVMRHSETGAQVVLQVAPAVATPSQFAERLTAGLRGQPGFITTDPEPLPLTESSVGFDFAVADKVQGRVAVLEGGPGQVFLVMATWPSDAPKEVTGSVDRIFSSLKAVPRAAGIGGSGR